MSARALPVRGYIGGGVFSHNVAIIGEGVFTHNVANRETAESRGATSLS